MVYSSPEIHSNLIQLGKGLETQAYNSKSEIFSIGLICLELLSKRSLMANSNAPLSVELFFSEGLLHNRLALIDSVVNYLSETQTDHQLLSLIRLMLKPGQQDRVNFQYLYDYFGLSMSSANQSGLLPFLEKIGVLCDPNVLLMAEIRKLFYQRANHEFCLVQFLIYSSKEVWDLANFNFGVEEVFDESLRAELLIISCCLALKAMIYLDNLRSCLSLRRNIFNIKNFHFYLEHPIHDEDQAYILNRISLAEDGSVKTFFAMILAQIESKESVTSRTQERLKCYSKTFCPKEEKIKNINDSAKVAIKTIVAHPCLEILKVLFEKFLRLIEDCFQEESTFQFRSIPQGAFDWEKFLEGRYPHLKGKFVFKTIKIPVRQ